MKNNGLIATGRIGQALPLDPTLTIRNPLPHSFCAAHKKCAGSDQPIRAVFWPAI
jgi:hypothetical protein